MNDKPRLIEVAFPLKQASIASVHEKNVRHGHLSTLHIWPARRPLAACRAALLATLLPDPGNPEKRKALLDKIGGSVTTKTVEEVDDDGNTVVEDKLVVEDGVLAWGREDSEALHELALEIRTHFGGRPPKILDPFAGGGAIPLEAMRLGAEVTASDLNPVAWFILKTTLDYPNRLAGQKLSLPDFVKDWPDFLDDFAVGKSKKRRSHQKAHFSDPAQRQLIEVPPADLSWQVRAWGRWVQERAAAELAYRYPTANDQPTVAYFWARTARDKATSGVIPLLKTFWLCKKRGRRSALLPLPAQDSSVVRFKLLSEFDLNNPQKIIDENPVLRRWEVTADNFLDFIKSGTKNSSGVWSPISGRPGMIALTMDDLRRQAQQGLVGTQMTAVVVEAVKPGTKRTTKTYRIPTEQEITAADVSVEDLDEVFAQIPFGVPAEPIATGSSRKGGGSAFTVPLFGLDSWQKLFTPRQLLALGTFTKHTRAASDLMRQMGYSADWVEAVTAGLALTCDKLADYIAALCTWHITGEKMSHVFVRFALPMTWDIAELNPLSSSSGNYSGCLDWVARVLQHAEQATHTAPAPTVLARSAILAGDTEFDLILTDPPYYDAIPYSDLMDFFYVWLRRNLRGLSPDIDAVFSQPLAPKWDHSANDGELIDDSSRFSGDNNKSRLAYEDGMFRAFRACSDKLSTDGRLVIVFANKQSEAWEALVSAVIRAGFVVDASWPIQTEMPNRTRGASSAALSSSVWIVCRKRDKAAPAGWEEQVIERMKATLFDSREPLGGINILQYYFDLGIQGPDFIWAALGPALEAFSAHPYVKKTAGGVMKVEEFLREVRKLVLHFSLGELPGFRDVQKETQGRGESLEIDSVTQYYLLHRAYFSLDPTPAGACILFANACGKNETELKVVWNILEQGGKPKKGRPRKEEDEDEDATEEAPEGKGNEYRLLAWQERTSAEGLGESKAGNPAPLIDKLHRLMFLFDRGRTVEVQQLFESWGLANEKAFKPMLQAVRELAVRDKQEGERRLVEALASQLRMNRKTIMVANEMKEVPLFDSVENIGQVLIN
jgi:putative DNA methylase